MSGAGVVRRVAYEELQDDILAELADDWFCFSQLMYLARAYVGTAEREMAEATLSALRYEAGRAGGDTPYPGCVS